MLLKRKETKSYGTKRLFEGNWKKNSTVAIVDDVLMTGGTLIDDIPVMSLHPTPETKASPIIEC